LSGTGKRGLFVRLLLLTCCTLLVHSAAEAAIQCYQCHGTQNPVDYRPLDAAYRNVTTGGFQGNHRSHLSDTNGFQQCERCHAGSSHYTQGHRDGSIQLSANLNNSPVRALYGNRTSAFPQTATPALETCSNVNCHFENMTPAWGSALFTYPGDCSGCHGAPPNGAGSSGAAGSHARHDDYFPGAAHCIKCHPGHTAFGHATSAGRPLVVIPKDPSNVAFGSYSGPVGDYLPSQDNRFGSCMNIYCHSNGTSLSTGTIPALTTPAWGGAALACTSCHASPPDYPDGAPKANSHARHQQKGYACSACHFGTTADNATISGLDRHVNKSYDISSGVDALSYSFAQTGGACSNGYCHSNGTAVSTGIIPSYISAPWGSGTLSCASCHAYPPLYANKTPKANSHSKHNTYGYGCAKCHYGTTADGVTISNQDNHVDHNYDVTPGNGVQFRFSSANSGGSCFNANCHHDGTGIATGVIASVTATWGKPVGCSGCHAARPSYANGSPKANSHMYQAHKLNCSVCHNATTANGSSITNLANHLNGAYDIAPNGFITMQYVYAPSGGSCTNTSCHATAEGARIWGAQPDDCNGCHESPPNTPSHTKHFSGTALQASYTSVSIAGDTSAGYLFNCANCHPRDMDIYHRDGFVQVELYDPTAPEGTVKALNPPEATYLSGGEVLFDGRNYPYTNGTCSSVYCHSYTSFTTPTDCTFTNESGSRYCDDYATANLAATRVYRDVQWNSQLPADCSGCHANAPRTDYTTNDGMTGDSHAWGNPWGYEQGHFNKEWFDMNPITCSTCHNDTVKVQAAWWRTPSPYYTHFSSVPIASHAKHVNGRNDVSFDQTRSFALSRTDWFGNMTTTYWPLSAAAYAPETKTCSNVSCHIGQASVKWGKTYRGYKAWSGIDYVCWECHNSGY